MKIQNNYHAYSGGEYQKSHTYSMPENSRGSGAETEDGEKSSRAAYGPAKGKEADIFIHTPESGKEQGKGSKKGVYFLPHGFPGFPQSFGYFLKKSHIRTLHLSLFHAQFTFQFIDIQRKQF